MRRTLLVMECEADSHIAHLMSLLAEAAQGLERISCGMWEFDTTGQGLGDQLTKQVADALASRPQRKPANVTRINRNKLEIVQ